MKIKCGNCGKDILVPDDLVVGQHVRCPYCNEKSAFDKPTRVALPEGFEVKRRARTKIDELKLKHEQAKVQTDLPAEEQKPKLGIRRPAQETKDREHMNAAAAAVHERIRKAERRQRILNFKKSFGNLTSLVGLVVLALVGYCIWKTVQKKEVPRPIAEIVEDVVEQVVPRQDDAEERRRTGKETQEQKRIEAEVAKEARKSEIEKLTAESKQNAEAYERIVSAFRKGRLLMANHRKIVEALGPRTDAFYICLAGEGASIYEVASASNGARRVVKRCADGTTNDELLNSFTNRLETAEYLMAHGNRVFFRSMRTSPMTGRLSIGENANPTELFFGKMYEVVKKLNLEYGELSFDIVFQPKNSTDETIVRTVRFGCDCSPAEVREAVAEAFPMKGAKDSMKIKKFKRTVVFWDGNMIKRDISGITHVPRSYSHRNHSVAPDVRERDYRRWSSLRSQAEREEREERLYYQREQRRVDEELAAANAAALKRWKTSVDDMLENGKLTYKAKIAKEAQ